MFKGGGGLEGEACCAQKAKSVQTMDDYDVA